MAGIQCGSRDFEMHPSNSIRRQRYNDSVFRIILLISLIHRCLSLIDFVNEIKRVIKECRCILVDRERANVSQFDKSFLRLEIKTRNRKKETLESAENLKGEAKRWLLRIYQNPYKVVSVKVFPCHTLTLLFDVSAIQQKTLLRHTSSRSVGNPMYTDRDGVRRD